MPETRRPPLFRLLVGREGARQPATSPQNPARGLFGGARKGVEAAHVLPSIAPQANVACSLCPANRPMPTCRAADLDNRATKSASSLRGLPIYPVRTVHDRIQEALEARAPRRDCWRVEPARNLLRDPRRIDPAAKQMLQVKFGIPNFFRF